MKKIILCAAIVAAFLFGCVCGTFLTIKQIKVNDIEHNAVFLEIAGYEHVYMFDEMEE